MPTHHALESPVEIESKHRYVKRVAVRLYGWESSVIERWPRAWWLQFAIPIFRFSATLSDLLFRLTRKVRKIFDWNCSLYFPHIFPSAKPQSCSLQWSRLRGTVKADHRTGRTWHQMTWTWPHPDKWKFDRMSILFYFASKLWITFDLTQSV